jgi:hypothetical protein
MTHGLQAVMARHVRAIHELFRALKHGKKLVDGPDGAGP